MLNNGFKRFYTSLIEKIIVINLSNSNLLIGMIVEFSLSYMYNAKFNRVNLFGVLSNLCNNLSP